MSQGMEPEQLAEAIISSIHAYTDDVKKNVAVAVKNASEITCEDVVEHSPVRKKPASNGGVIMVRRNGGKVPAADNLQPGAYKKGWIKVIREYSGRERVQGYIRNKTNYQLVHLLELGHKSRDGSRVKAIPHVKPGQEKGREYLDKEIKRILNQE